MLAVMGHNALLEGSGSAEWDGEAMYYGGRLVHDLAERLAARLSNRRTRWRVPVGEDFVGEDEPEEGGA